jgi:NAD(P)-dependent dehydrogenase (short-subunit alcohol dehydrogenase family)
MTAARSTRLEGVTSVVTGGGRGLGRLVAQTLAGAGARVGIIARTSSELEATVAMIHQDGGVAVAATADITDDAPTASAFDTIRRAIGPIDVLVNDAAINGPVGAFPDIDLREWWQTIEVLSQVFEI